MNAIFLNLHNQASQNTLVVHKFETNTNKLDKQNFKTE